MTSSRTLRPIVVPAVVVRLLRINPSVLGTDIAAMAVRIALVWIFTYYGAGKLFGWFGGPGIHRSSIFFSTTAHLHPGELFAVTAGITELGAAVALAFGLLSRLAAMALFVDQVVAMITVSWAHGINSLSATPGYEFNLALATMALVIVGLGAGRLSLDAVLGHKIRPLDRPDVLAASSDGGEAGHFPVPLVARRREPGAIGEATCTSPLWVSDTTR